MDTYRVDISSILEVLAETIEVSDEITFDAFSVGTEEFKPTAPAHFDVTITNTGTAVVAMGTVVLPVEATCARCLLEFPMSITADVDGFYLHPGEENGVPEEQEIEYIDENGYIDLFPAILAGLVLEAPFAPLHDESCAGICSSCGADLNEGACECAPDTDDVHPFAALKGLLGESGDGSSTE
jgi:uncharacterized protein